MIKEYVKYWINTVLSIPLIPIFITQGIALKRRIPALPEASDKIGKTNTCFSKNFKLIALGESTVAGFGINSHKNGLIGTLANELSTHLKSNVYWEVSARNGYNINKIRTLLIPEIKEKTPDLIIIGIGGNDAFEITLPRKWKNETKKLILELKNKFPQTSIVFIHMPPVKYFTAFSPVIKFIIGNQINLYTKTLSLLVEKEKYVHFISSSLNLIRNNPTEQVHLKDLFSDGIHPSLKAYQLWGRDIFNFIKYNLTLFIYILIFLIY